MPRKVTESTVERKIYFYRIDPGTDSAGRPIGFNPRPLLHHINGLPWDLSGRYWLGRDGNLTSCWIDGTSPAKLRLGTSRRSGLPQVETHGIMRPLRIKVDSGLAETIHILFFPHNIIGSEFNFYGPRVSRLSHYAAAKAVGVCPAFDVLPLLRRDVFEQLERLQDIRLFRIKARASFADVISRADQNLGEAFRAAIAAGSADEAEIILKMAPYSRQSLLHKLIEVAKRLLRIQSVHDDVSGFQVKGLDGQTGEVELIDLLNDKLISKKQIILQGTRTRALKAESAYFAIREAYDELRDELALAAGLSA